ncbi:MAG: DedA family protein [Candidatus Riflemargulisbacteria bacterium]
MISSIFSPIIAWYMAHINYGTICLLMTVESTFLPFPSEVVVPPAAWKAASGDLNIFLVVLAASFGAVFGALINYHLAAWLGRPLIYKFANSKLAKVFLIEPKKIEEAEKLFLKNANTSTFIGRLIPGIRHLISIPAGLAKMPMRFFLLFTFIGATIWNITLALLGFFFFSQKEYLEQYYKELTVGLLIIGILYLVYLFIKLSNKKKTTLN